MTLVAAVGKVAMYPSKYRDGHVLLQEWWRWACIVEGIIIIL